MKLPKKAVLLTGVAGIVVAGGITTYAMTSNSTPSTQSDQTTTTSTTQPVATAPAPTATDTTTQSTATPTDSTTTTSPTPAPAPTQPATQTTTSSVTQISDPVTAMNDAGIAADQQNSANSLITQLTNWQFYDSTNPNFNLCRVAVNRLESQVPDWATNPVGQLSYCNSYALARYGSWDNALQHYSATGVF